MMNPLLYLEKALIQMDMHLYLQLTELATFASLAAAQPCLLHQQSRQIAKVSVVLKFFS